MGVGRRKMEDGRWELEVVIHIAIVIDIAIEIEIVIAIDIE